MSESVLDFAGLESAAAEVETPAVETEVETPAAGAEVDAPEVKDGEEGSLNNADGTPKEKVEDLPGTKATPQNIRQALKAMRDADPKNAAVVKELHGAYERYGAYAKVFPKVSDAVDAKNFLETVGGQEGYETLTSAVANIQETDQLLYAGDPKLLENIVADLKSEGKLEALGKLAPAFLDAVKANDEKAYYAAFAPHFLDGVDKVNLPGAISAIAKALENSVDKDGKVIITAEALKEALGVVGGMDNWYKGLKQQTLEAKKAPVDNISPEREKLNADIAAHNKTKVTEFQTGVARDCEKYNNITLGKHLAPFLKEPFFKGFPRETLIDLGNGIKQRLYSTLKADVAYQKQMDAMWKAKSPDRAKINEYHNAKLDSIAEDIVRKTVQSRYPGYAKGGVGAGKKAAAEVKKAAVAATDQKAVAQGKPIYVAKKPAYDAIDHDKDPKQYLEIAGRAYLRGSGKLVTWRK